MSLRPTILAMLTALAFTAAAAAQTAPGQAPPDKLPLDKDKKDWVQPPANPPKPQRGDRTRNLDFLFGALKAAPDEASAKHIEDRIWALWLVPRRDTRHLLMTPGQTTAPPGTSRVATPP